MTYAPADNFGDLYAQTGFSNLTVEVTGGVMIYLTLPTGTLDRQITIQTDKPIPAESAKWWTEQAKAKLWRRREEMAKLGFSDSYFRPGIREECALTTG